MGTDWNTFDHDRDLPALAKEREPVWADDKRDPIVTLPPDETDEDQSAALSGEHPWHTSPAEVWHNIWDITENYRPYIVFCDADTGVNPHDSLPKPLAERSFIQGQSPRDPNSGHGTHTTSTMCASMDLGVCPGAQFIIAKVLSNGGSGSSSGIAAGIKWASEWRGPDGLRCVVGNLSLGGPSRYGPTIANIVAARNQDVPCWWFASAGNSGLGGEGFPAKDPAVPSVAAHDRNNNIASFSSRGNVWIAAPGVNIIGASNRSRTGRVSMSGTSMSCPFISGLWGLVTCLQWASGRPRRWTRDDVRDVFFKAYAIDEGPAGWDRAWGHGRIDYQRMIRDMDRFGRDFVPKAMDRKAAGW